MSSGRPVFLAPDGTPRSESAYGVWFLFTGREYLAPVGLYDYRHRAYSPTLRRFLQVDPMRQSAQGHLYAYCQNSPNAGRDPDGRFWWKVIRRIREIIRFRRKCREKDVRGDLERLGEEMWQLGVERNNAELIDMALEGAGAAAVRPSLLSEVLDASGAVPSATPLLRSQRPLKFRASRRGSYFDKEGRAWLLDLDSGRHEIVE